MAKIKIDWANHIAGFVSVVLGVLMAFWLNSWSEERKVYANMRVALENIKSEISRNSSSLDTILIENRKLHSFLSIYLNSVDANMKVMVPNEQWIELVNKYPEYLTEDKSGVQVDLDLFQLSDVAWTAAHRTDAFSSIDFGLAFQLERAYDLQERLNEFDTSLIEDLKSIGGQKESFERLHRSLGFALGLGDNLKEKSYKQSIDAIDQYLQN